MVFRNTPCHISKTLYCFFCKYTASKLKRMRAKAVEPELKFPAPGWLRLQNDLVQ